jgi:hypothetical protein
MAQADRQAEPGSAGGTQAALRRFFLSSLPFITIRERLNGGFHARSPGPFLCSPAARFSALLYPAHPGAPSSIESGFRSWSAAAAARNPCARARPNRSVSTRPEPDAGASIVQGLSDRNPVHPARRSRNQAPRQGAEITWVGADSLQRAKKVNISSSERSGSLNYRNNPWPAKASFNRSFCGVHELKESPPLRVRVRLEVVVHFFEGERSPPTPSLPRRPVAGPGWASTAHCGASAGCWGGRSTRRVFGAVGWWIAWLPLPAG